MALLFSGCSIMEKSDSLSAEGHIRVSGGLLGYVLPNIDIGGKIGFFRQNPDGNRVAVDLKSLCQEDRLKVLEALYDADTKPDDGALTPLEHFL